MNGPRVRRFLRGLLITIFTPSLTWAMTGGRDVGDADPMVHSVVGLYYVKGETGLSCTATFIARDLLITAAHCLYLKSKPLTIDTDRPRDFFIRLGNANAKNFYVAGEWAPIVDVRTHPKFSSGDRVSRVGRAGYYAHDIALVRIDPAYLRDQQRPLPLAGGLNPNFVLRIFGFGPRSGEPSRNFVLRTMDVRLGRSRLSAAGALEVYFRPIRRVRGYVGLNHGDSGGPLIATDGDHSEIVGVDSGGASYIPVFVYADWLSAAG